MISALPAPYARPTALTHDSEVLLNGHVSGLDGEPNAARQYSERANERDTAVAGLAAGPASANPSSANPSSAEPASAGTAHARARAKRGTGEQAASLPGAGTMDTARVRAGLAFL